MGLEKFLLEGRSFFWSVRGYVIPCGDFEHLGVESEVEQVAVLEPQLMDKRYSDLEKGSLVRVVECGRKYN